MSPGSTPATSVAAQLGLNLRQLRAVTGQRQEDIAARAGIARSHYAALESGNGSNGGEANPRLNTLLDLAAALNVPVRVLLDGLDRPSLGEAVNPTPGRSAAPTDKPESSKTAK